MCLKRTTISVALLGRSYCTGVDPALRSESILTYPSHILTYPSQDTRAFRDWELDRVRRIPASEPAELPRPRAAASPRAHPRRRLNCPNRRRYGARRRTGAAARRTPKDIWSVHGFEAPHNRRRIGAAARRARTRRVAAWLTTRPAVRQTARTPGSRRRPTSTPSESRSGASRAPVLRAVLRALGRAGFKLGPAGLARRPRRRAAARAERTARWCRAKPPPFDEQRRLLRVLRELRVLRVFPRGASKGPERWLRSARQPTLFP